MIPNIFITSTINDLRYLRDGLREAVSELAYNPVMSEYGEIGYLNPETAAASCYRSIQQCQMAVIIVGCRYGNPSEEGGISVTHKEFRTAREYKIPLIAFVEHQVMSYKEVYKASQDEEVWKKFPHMDNAALTFSLLDEITNAEFYNGLIPFTNVAEAKKLLKQQIADFVGQSLSQVFSPMRSEIKDVLAEIKTLRQEVAGQQKSNPVFISAIRFIIDENRSKGLKYLIEHTIGPLDKAIPIIVESKTFDEFVEKAGIKLTVVDNLSVATYTKDAPDTFFGAMSFGIPSPNNPIGFERADFIIGKKNTIQMNPAAHSHFDWTYHALKMEIGIK